MKIEMLTATSAVIDDGNGWPAPANVSEHYCALCHRRGPDDGREHGDGPCEHKRASRRRWPASSSSPTRTIRGRPSSRRWSRRSTSRSRRLAQPSRATRPPFAGWSARSRSSPPGSDRPRGRRVRGPGLARQRLPRQRCLRLPGPPGRHRLVQAPPRAALVLKARQIEKGAGSAHDTPTPKAEAPTRETPTSTQDTPDLAPGQIELIVAYDAGEGLSPHRIVHGTGELVTVKADGQVIDAPAKDLDGLYRWLQASGYQPAASAGLTDSTLARGSAGKSTRGRQRKGKVGRAHLTPRRKKGRTTPWQREC